MSVATVSISDCRRLVESNKMPAVIDVRTPSEFARLHVKGARLMPIDEFDAKAIAASRLGAGEPIYVICQSGGRASKACQRLEEAGVPNVFCVEGGTAAWEKAGLPVERSGGKVISLERQVRIGAGALVLIGTVLAWRVHPLFLAIPTFVGAGLMFAGITDYCGMGMLLSKMPWNRHPGV